MRGPGPAQSGRFLRCLIHKKFVTFIISFLKEITFSYKLGIGRMNHLYLFIFSIQMKVLVSLCIITLYLFITRALKNFGSMSLSSNICEDFIFFYNFRVE